MIIVECSCAVVTRDGGEGHWKVASIVQTIPSRNSTHDKLLFSVSCEHPIRCSAIPINPAIWAVSPVQEVVLFYTVGIRIHIRLFLTYLQH